MTVPPLCVVMPAYNAAPHIEAALDSLFRQSTSDFEIIVVDDGSTDDTPAIVERWAARDGGPPLRLLRQTQQGPSAARNRAIATTQAPLIGFLDADDLWYAHKAQHHIDLLARHPEVLLTFSGFHYIDAAGQDLHQSSMPVSETLTYAKLLERNIIHTSTVVVRRDAVLGMGGFDETLRTYEDLDLWLRIASAGPTAIHAIQDILTAYRRHPAQTTGSWHAMHAGWRDVMARQQTQHPEVWRIVRPRAEAFQYEYCAALAYNAGDTRAARQLIWKCWRVGGAKMLRSPDTLLMTAICLATYLPRPLQIALGWAYSKARAVREALRASSKGAKPTHDP